MIGHHVAFASRNLEATHRFYGALLGLELVNTELSRAETGWLRHVFYDLGDGSAIAFFDLHGCGEPMPLKTAISTDLGLAIWLKLDHGLVPVGVLHRSQRYPGRALNLTDWRGGMMHRVAAEWPS